uniref:Uncharacterized protein n=1 Tax=Tanacetum cinerariifolium TaxID=118510 RepID=A0A699SJY3_TANCI|nr:hypothetical protein [Tanacetum cinerariifolium]
MESPQLVISTRRSAGPSDSADSITTASAVMGSTRRGITVIVAVHIPPGSAVMVMDVMPASSVPSLSITRVPIVGSGLFGFRLAAGMIVATLTQLVDSLTGDPHKLQGSIAYNRACRAGHGLHSTVQVGHLHRATANAPAWSWSSGMIMGNGG